jgi:phosphoribosylformylglycinamidine cyclo-ligase
VTGSTDYRSSGVDIHEGGRAVELMRSSVRSTFTPAVLSDIGHFGGLFRASFPGMSEPVLAASTDGVGTKLKVAAMAGSYGTVGMDLVNHCVNDILVLGAEPLFFLDYIACGRLDASVAADIVSGLASACRDNGCALLGGETAEMPGFYAIGDYDVAGTVVGVVERGRIVDGSSIRPGMTVVGLPSTGLHTNGYSLARKVLFDLAGMSPSDRPEALRGDSVAGALLAVHRSYLHALRPLLQRSLVRGMAHVTGGGIPGNLSRILPSGCGAVIRPDWPVPAVFGLIGELGAIEPAEMYQAFNMGAGMLMVCSGEDLAEVMTILRSADERPFAAGEIVEGEGVVMEPCGGAAPPRGEEQPWQSSPLS